jgi:hypothetical protein
MHAMFVIISASHYYFNVVVFRWPRRRSRHFCIRDKKNVMTRKISLRDTSNPPLNLLSVINIGRTHSVWLAFEVSPKKVFWFYKISRAGRLGASEIRDRIWNLKTSFTAERRFNTNRRHAQRYVEWSPTQRRFACTFSRLCSLMDISRLLLSSHLVIFCTEHSY